MNNPQYLKEPDNFVVNNAAINTSETYSKSPRRSSRIIKPSSLNNHSTYINTLFFQTDEEDGEISKVHKKKKKNKGQWAGGTRCCVMNCQNKYPSSKLSFFKLPHCLSTRNIWIKNCDIKSLVGSNSTVKGSYRICESHFENDMFRNTAKRKRLKPNAVPTIFNNKNTSQLLCAKNEFIENVEDLSTNDISFIKSSNLQNTKDKQETSCITDTKEHNATTQRNLELQACCIPGCINSADYLNEHGNAKPGSFSIFTPSSIENMNEWRSIFGIRITLKSNVCERHFNPEDICFRSICTPGTYNVGIIKSLKLNAIPLKIQKYRKTSKKRSRVKKCNIDISTKKKRKIEGKSKIVSKFGKLSEDKKNEIIESAPSISILNSTTNLNNESINSFSNITSNTLLAYNAHSSLGEILPKMSPKNFLFSHFQPNVEQNKQVSKTKSMKITNANDGLNQSKKLVGEHSITSQDNFIQTNLQSNSGQKLLTKLTNKISLSKVKKNNNQSSQILATQFTEETNFSHEIKIECFDNLSQTFLVDDPITDEFQSQSNVEQILPINPSISSELNIKNNKQLSSGVGIIGQTVLNSIVEVNPELINDIPKTTYSSQSNVDNSLSTNSSIAQYEQVSIIQSTEIINEVSNSSSSISVFHSGKIKNQIKSFKSNLSNDVSDETINISDQVLSSTLLESNPINDDLNQNKKLAKELSLNPHLKIFKENVSERNEYEPVEKKTKYDGSRTCILKSTQSRERVSHEDVSSTLKSPIISALTNEEREGRKNNNKNYKEKKKYNNQDNIVFMNNELSNSTIQNIENICDESPAERTVWCCNMNKIIETSKFGQFCEDFNMLHKLNEIPIINDTNPAIIIPIRPTTQHSTTTENVSLNKIQYLYQKYFNKSSNDNIVIIANILNLILLCVEHYEAKIKPIQLNTAQLEEHYNDEKMYLKHKRILRWEFKKYFMKIISEFVDSEFELAFKMLFVSILCVFKKLDPQKFQRSCIYKKAIVLLWNVLKKSGFKRNKNFEIIHSKTFRLNCINVINLIKDYQRIDPGITHRMPIFFMPSLYSKNYFKAAIDAVSSHFHEDLALLIDSAASQYCVYSSLSDSMYLPSSSTANQNMNLETPITSVQSTSKNENSMQLTITQNKTLKHISMTDPKSENNISVTPEPIKASQLINSHNESSSRFQCNLSTETISPKIVTPEESVTTSAINISNGFIQNRDTFAIDKPLSQSIVTMSITSTPGPEEKTIDFCDKQYNVLKYKSQKDLLQTTTVQNRVNEPQTSLQSCDLGSVTPVKNEIIPSICFEKNCQKIARLICSSCKLAKYCSYSCQRLDWYETHSLNCNQFKTSD